MLSNKNINAVTKLCSFILLKLCKLRMFHFATSASMFLCNLKKIFFFYLFIYLFIYFFTILIHCADIIFSEWPKIMKFLNLFSVKCLWFDFIQCCGFFFFFFFFFFTKPILSIANFVRNGLVTPPHTHTSGVLSIALNHLMVRLQSWSLGECGVPLHCDYSWVHSNLEW